MTLRLKYLLPVFLGIGLLAFHAAFKQKIDRKKINELLEYFSTRESYIGTYAPNFSITLLDGSDFKLSDNLSNHVVVLNFFTTWCEPCRSEMRELEHFVKRTEKMDVKFLAINVGETRQTVEGFIQAENIRLPIAVDTKEQVSAKYQIRAYPTTVVIHPSGRIMMYEQGAIDNTDVSLFPQVARFSEILKKRGGSFDLDDYFKNAPEILPPPKEDNKTTNTTAEVIPNE